MKSIYNSILYILCAQFVLLSCTDDFSEINTDPKNSTVDGIDDGLIPLVAKKSFYGAVYMGQNANGPFQLGHSLFSDVYANYFATTAAGFDSDQFILVDRWLNGAYAEQYGNVAPELKFALDYTAERDYFSTENAMMKVWKVFFFHRLTDYWGPIPYSNFGEVESGPVMYDSQKDIYADFFNLLDEAVATFDTRTGQSVFFGNTANDIIYNGSVDNWKALANSLRLRLALRIKYVDGALAKSEAEKAVASGVIMNNSQNAYVNSDNGNFRNNYTTITQWGEFRMSADMESVLKGYKDPRVANYFAPADSVDTLDDPVGLTFDYEGMRNGQTANTKTATPFNTMASDMAGEYTVDGSVGPPYPILRAAEAYFLRAEGALEGWAMNGTAKDLYEQGIQMSHAEYEYDGTNLSGEDYISSTNVPAGFDSTTPPASTAPIAYDEAADKERQLEQIITQKWIALFPDSEEAYAERRRTGYPTLYDRLNSLIPSQIPVDEIPRRMPYVSDEYNNNREAIDDAVNNPEKLDGLDDGTTKLWWDKKN